MKLDIWKESIKNLTPYSPKIALLMFETNSSEQTIPLKIQFF